MKSISLRTILGFLFFATSVLSISAQDYGKYPPQRLTHHMTPEEQLSRHLIGRGFVETPPPAGNIISLAEFERAKGALVRYPFGIPIALIREMARDAIVTTLVSGPSQETTVRNQYISAGVNLANCNFVHAPSDSYWTRDYGPLFISYGDNQIGIVDFPYNRPRPNDDNVPVKIAEFLGLQWFGMNVIHTGGNYMTDSYGMAASTTIAYTENPGQTPAQIDQKMQDYLGIDDYHVLPDPNNTYIDHIDCWGKYLGTNKVLIRSVPSSHPQYDEIEATVDYFESVTTPWGVPYEIFRVNTPQNQPYTNSFILNDKIFVPSMGTQYDEPALEVYRQAMPGYKIFGIIGQASTPWESTDAIHCRVHEMADPEMLSIRHYPLLSNIEQATDYTFDANVVSYGGSEIISDSVLLYYRVNPNIYTPFQSVNMTNVSGSQWSASISSPEYGSTVQYYIHAADSSGRSENHPFIGKPDPHEFYVGEQLFANAGTDLNEIELTTMKDTEVEEFINISNTGELGLNYFISVSTDRADTIAKSLPDSPAAGAYNSNTLVENGWTTLNVFEEGVLSEIILSYNWTTDNYPTEGSFWAESPSGAQFMIAAGQNTGTYTVGNNNFAGEELQGIWKFWIEDSYGDGGHQAKNISVKFVRVIPTGDWLSVEPTEGTVEPGSSHPLTVICDASGMELGVYHGIITILSNDPDEPELMIPVIFTVSINVNSEQKSIESLDVKVYPNPGHGIYTIELTGDDSQLLDIELTDLTGRVLFSRENAMGRSDRNFTLSMPELKQGVFILYLKAEGYQKAIKIIKN
ncbi:MAG: agmatine deiminase family protein [Lentimicrobium sp.]|nr:agmatine deiminase family protein [Lentimicrobium sp.]